VTEPTLRPGLDAALRGKFAQAEWLWAETARLRDAIPVSRHPFQRCWSAGTLSGGDLQAFAGEHHHCVVALAGTARRAARLADGLLAEELTRYAEDQEDYVDLWCEFAMAAGWGRGCWYFGEDPLPPTVACSRAWSGENRSLAQHLITLYAVQSILAETVPAQFEALAVRYKFDLHSIRYFVFQAEQAAGDAAMLEAALTSQLPLVRPLALSRQAESTRRAYWDLLGGIQALAEAAP
jgi:pyrroloquinoline quinone (PQQ) biosynthesis protein C